MCGIAGEWITRPSMAGPPDMHSVLGALARLRHRGPDGEGMYAAHRGVIGMTRLSVRGSVDAVPPYVSEDGHIGAVMNGELYNYEELRAFVLARGHMLKTGADSELLPHLYEEWGADMLPRLTGMFALAVLDRSRGSVLLARDRLGLKPLYLWETPGRLRFASELKAFAAWPDFAPEIDETLIPRYLFHRYVPAPRTLVRGVSKLPAGHRLRPQDSLHPRSESWWTLSERPLQVLPTSIEDAARTLKTQWTSVMHEHLAADRQVGVMLSSGVDSAWVAWAAAQETRGLPALTLGPGASLTAEDESGAASQLAAELGLVSVPVPVKSDVENRLLAVAEALDEPLGDPTVLTFDMVAEAARELGLTVLLTGEGADEVFAGYPSYGEAAWLERLRPLALAIRQARLERLLDADWPGLRRLRSALHPVENHYGGVGVVRRALDPDMPGASIMPWAQPGRTRLKSMLAFDLTCYLPEDVLTKCDRLGMRHQIEVRVPYLDHRIVEWAFSLPDPWLVSGQRGKRVLRQAAFDGLGPVATRPKLGFPTPLTEWLQGPLHDLAHDVLASQEWLSAGERERLWQTFQLHPRAASRELYAGVMLGLFIHGVESMRTGRGRQERAEG